MFCTIWSLWPSSIFGPAEPQRMHLRFAINKSALRKMEDINFGIWRTYPRNIRDLGGRNSRFLRNASQFWFKVWFPEVPCKKHKKHEEACPVLLLYLRIETPGTRQPRQPRMGLCWSKMVQDGPRSKRNMLRRKAKRAQTLPSARRYRFTTTFGLQFFCEEARRQDMNFPASWSNEGREASSL